MMFREDWHIAFNALEFISFKETTKTHNIHMDLVDNYYPDDSISINTLSKILMQLAHMGILESTAGPFGGYRRIKPFVTFLEIAMALNFKCHPKLLNSNPSGKLYKKMLDLMEYTKTSN